MSLSRVVIIAAVCLGLTAAVAQQREATTAATAPTPLFQGVMVDAKGKTVGRVLDSNGTVVRQIGGVWVAFQAFVDGFEPRDPPVYYFQSIDCTGTGYLADQTILPVHGFVATVPPATTPSIYYPAGPSLVTLKSGRPLSGGACEPVGPATEYAGIAQSVTASSLGPTAPFSVK